MDCSFAGLKSGSVYKSVSVSPFTLHYQVFGHGSELLLAFHGFGKSSNDFLVLEASLGSKYTIIAIDFFYHGEKGLSAEQKIPVFTPSHMSALIEKLLWEYKRVKCSLLGYSQGARIVMGVVHRLPHRIQELFLVAPDGLRKQRTRHFVGNTRVGRYLGLYLVHKPRLLRLFIRISAALKLIPAGQARFFEHQLAQKSGRFRVYHTWLSLRNYHPHPALMRHYINDRKIRTIFFAGKYDSIIPLATVRKFIRKLGKRVRLIEMECGHDVLSLHPEIAARILEEKA